MKMKSLFAVVLVAIFFSANAQQGKVETNKKRYTAKDIKSLPSNVLYVINGNIVGTGKGVVEKMKPSSIKSLNRITDPATTAKYGTRGANGVILITTDERKQK